MSDPRPSLMRSLGQFFGHIAQGAKTRPDAADDGETIEVSRETSTEHRQPPSGSVTLRRTTIEEVTVPRESLTDPARSPEEDAR